MATKSKKVPKSTMELILEKLVDNLKKKTEFDEATLDNLAELTKTGGLSHPTKVEDILKGNWGNEK